MIRLYSLHSLALTRISFRDFPLRYDRRGGSLKIFLSCGWFCIKCHFPISISFKFGNESNKIVDGPARLLRFAMIRLYSLHSLALTRISFRDFPLRYDRRGGSLKIFLSCGWFCIKCHFPISISFKFGNAGWYCVTKGRIFFRAVLFLFVSDVSLSENLTSDRCFSTVAAG